MFYLRPRADSITGRKSLITSARSGLNPFRTAAIHAGCWAGEERNPMQPYDIVSKLWIEQCTEVFLKELVRARVKQFEPIEELAQEQPAISRADYVLKAKTPAGTSQVFVLE